MSQNLLYTFRTFPNQDSLEFDFIFGRLKEGLPSILDSVVTQAPKYVIGIAATNSDTKIESLAMNRFNKVKIVEPDGPDKYSLYIPEQNIFIISDTYTTSFCNWTMYKISKFLQDNKLESKLIFIHVNNADIELLKNFVNNL